VGVLFLTWWVDSDVHAICWVEGRTMFRSPRSSKNRRFSGRPRSFEIEVFGEMEWHLWAFCF